jgi:hypothetical protein
MPLQASTPAIHTQGSLRGGTPPLNGGSGGSLPQIRVLPTTKKTRIPQILIIVPINLHQVLPITKKTCIPQILIIVPINLHQQIDRD